MDNLFTIIVTIAQAMAVVVIDATAIAASFLWMRTVRARRDARRRNRQAHPVGKGAFR